jgi:hypothetical protein
VRLSGLSVSEAFGLWCLEEPAKTGDSRCQRSRQLRRGWSGSGLIFMRLHFSGLCRSRLWFCCSDVQTRYWESDNIFCARNGRILPVLILILILIIIVPVPAPMAGRDYD